MGENICSYGDVKSMLLLAWPGRVFRLRLDDKFDILGVVSKKNIILRENQIQNKNGIFFISMNK
jgi:hypothetical protein